MKNKVTILNNLSGEITPISISDLENIVPQLPSGITVPNDSYGGFIPIHYTIDNDINFSVVKFFLNDELIYDSIKPTDTFNINVTTEFNKLSGYSVNRFDLKLPQTEFEVIFKTTLDQTKSQLEISKILKYNLPNFILDDYPVFVNFVEAYYQFLEKSNNPNLIHYNLENYKDIDSVPEYIVDYFRKELIPNFDLNLTKDRQTGESLNERVLIKHIKEFYDSKGTENSIKFLFRILFDKEATIFYPKVNLLKPSDGVWTIDKTIDVYGTDIVRLYRLVGTTIYQRKTTGEIESHAIIKNVNVKKIPGGFQGSLFLYELSGTFSNTTAILLKEVLDGVSVETPLTVIKISNKNLTISPGRRDSLGGNLSETKRLIPDNDYWQNASYDVQGDADPKSFISIIKKLAHPAGFKIFASYSPTLKLSKTINIKNEVIISNSFGSPKTFLNDLISKTDSLDILLVGDSNIHFGGQDGGYMYGWSYTLDELGVPCYSTPLFPSLTRSLATFAGASGIFKYFPGANTSTNAEYDSTTNNYWWKSNSAFGDTGYLVKKNTWLGSTVSDTYATWINNIWKCGTASGIKTTSGWHTFNSLVDWAYIKPGVTTSYDSTRNINIAKTGFSDADQTLGANKIYGSNPAWYGNFPVEKELNYRNVNVKFPGTNGGSIYLTSRNATNFLPVGSSATPSYYGRYSTDSGTSEYKIQADVLTILANPARKYVDAAWQGAHNGNFGKGPIATLLESVSVKNQKGYAVNSFHARSGHTAQNIASGLEAAGTESIKIYLKEIRDRQISSGGSGRVLIFVNMGVNSNSGAENTLFGDRAERIIVSISTAWSALGYPKSDLGFLISNSHNGADPNYTNPTAVIATAEYLKNKYSNVMLVNFDNDTLGSVTRLTNISGYINANSSVDAKSTGTTNPQVHLSQGRNVLTGTTTKTLNGEGGYAAVISGLITTVKTSSFTSPVTSTTTDNSTVNNTQENTGLTIGNYLAYSSDIVQDLNFLKTDNTDDSTDITSTYRAFPDGLPFGPDGKTPTLAAKSYITAISTVAAINISQFQPELIEEEVYFRSNIIGGTTFTGTSDNKLTSAITNIGQLVGEEEISERWECGNHPRTVLNPSEQIFSPDAAFGDLKISYFVGEEDSRSVNSIQQERRGKKIIDMDRCWQEQRDFWNAWWNFEKYGTRFGGGNSMYPPYGRCFGTTVGGQYCLSDIEYLKDQWEACRKFNTTETGSTYPIVKLIGGGDACREMDELHKLFKSTVIKNDLTLKVELSEINRQYEIDMNWGYVYFAGTAVVSLCSGTIGGGAAKAYFWMRPAAATKVVNVMDQVIINVGKMDGVGTLTTEEVRTLAMNAYNPIFKNGEKFIEVQMNWAKALRMVRPTESQLITGECIAAGVTPYQVLTKLQIEGFNNTATLYKEVARIMGVRTPTQATSQWLAANFSTLSGKTSTMIETMASSSAASNGIFYKLTSKVLYNDWKWSASAFERFGYFDETIAARCMSPVCGTGGSLTYLQPLNPSSQLLMEAAVTRQVVVKAMLEANVNVAAQMGQAAKTVSYTAAVTAGIANVASDAWGLFTGELFTGQMNKANEDYLRSFKLYNDNVMKYSAENTAIWNRYCAARDACNKCNTQGSAGSGSGNGSGSTSTSSSSSSCHNEQGSGGSGGGAGSPGLNILDEPIDPIDPEIIDDINNTIDGLIASSIIKHNIEQSSEDVINRL